MKLNKQKLIIDWGRENGREHCGVWQFSRVHQNSIYYLPKLGRNTFFFFGCAFVSFFIMVMVRMAMGWDRTKGWGLHPLSYPIPTLPRIMGKIFLPHASLSPRALWSPTPSRKTLLFVNFPHNYNIYIYIYIYFNETYFINKNILEITTKFIP